MFPDSLDESLILLGCPFKESSLRELTEPFFVSIIDFLVVILSQLNLLSQCLQLLKILIELKIVHSRNLDRAIILLYGLLCLLIIFRAPLLLVMHSKIIHHGLIHAVVKHCCLPLLSALNEMCLSLHLILLLLCDNLLNLLSLLAVVFILKH
jgi:hypothetical protein